MITKKLIDYRDEQYKVLVENLQLNDDEITQCCLLNEEFLFSKIRQQYGISLKSEISKECVKNILKKQ